MISNELFIVTRRSFEALLPCALNELVDLVLGIAGFDQATGER